MKKLKSTYSVEKRFSAIFMSLALLWLTISTPFVFHCQQELAKYSQHSAPASPLAGTEEETGGANSTEEKVPKTNNSVSEEYLHDRDHAQQLLLNAAAYHNRQNATTYVAFHGELLVPPPNRA